MRIYCITNAINGKQYVGQTTQSIDARWKQHCLLQGKCRAIENAIRKYGVENFGVHEVATAAAQDEMDRLEQLWIEQLGTVSPKGYNLRGGGGGVGSMHSETKAIFRKFAERPEHRERFAAIRLRPDVVAKQAAAREKLWSDPTEKACRLAVMQSGAVKPAAMAKKSKALKAAWEVPENRSVWLRGLQETQRPEAKAKRAASMILAWKEPGAREQRADAIRAAKSTPEFKARYAATNARPEVKARRSAASSARRETPEQRAARSARQTGVKLGPQNRAYLTPEFLAKRGDAIREGKKRKREALAA